MGKINTKKLVGLVALSSLPLLVTAGEGSIRNPNLYENPKDDLIEMGGKKYTIQKTNKGIDLIPYTPSKSFLIF